MKLIKYLSLIISLGLLLGISSGTVVAAGLAPPADTLGDSIAKTDACSGLQQIDPADTCTTTTDNGPIKNIVLLLIRVLSIFVGVISVIVIIFSGFRFITANGDANAISSARNTLIYAIVGLIIAVLAQFLVVHVLNSASGVQSGFTNNQTGFVRDS
jgi:hypothetical protein